MTRRPRPNRRTTTSAVIINREPKAGDLVLFQANGRREVGVVGRHGIESPTGCYRKRPIIGIVVPDK